MTGWQDEILVGYVDGELDPETAGRIEAEMVRDPELRRRVEIFRATSKLIKDAFQSMGDEPVPLALLAKVRGAGPGSAARRARLRRGVLALAASIAVLVAGAAGGFYAGIMEREDVGHATHFHWVEEMVNYYKVYADDDRRLVEIGGDRRADIEAWFSERLHHAMRIPDLSGQGLTFRGGRLVALDGRPATMLVYDGMGGGPVAFCITPVPQAEHMTPAVAQMYGFQVVYWARSGYVFMVAGAADAAQLRALVSHVDLAIGKG
jgi:anti-sigma factor RsiW